MAPEHFSSTSGISDALVILGAAGIVIPAFARFRISPVIGFILIGLLVGPAGLGSMTGEIPWLHYITISNADAIEPFAELGVILLLFSIGLELSFRRLWSMRQLVFGAGAAELLVSAAVIGLGQRAAGRLVGEQHRPGRVEDLGGLGHEVDAAHRDDLGVGAGGLPRQSERVADEVGHVLHLGHLVVMSQDDGVALAGQLAHLGLERRDLFGGQAGVGR